MKYKVTKAWGKHRVGEILPESREVRRKLKEGGCLEPIGTSSKKMEQPYKNKMETSSKNKGDE